MLTDKRVVVTGGTGSVGQVIVRRLLSGEMGRPKQVVVFSRDEAKQHEMRIRYQRQPTVTDEVIYGEAERALRFQIGDVRDLHSVEAVLHNADVVFHAAALKQVPSCEYFPFEAVQTNIYGIENIVRVIRETHVPVDTVIGISTDKACLPVNVMGMTKAIQERIIVQANLDCPTTRFVCVRYGNVLASTGSVIPLFRSQVLSGGPVTITTPEMTRFLLSLESAVDTIFEALRSAAPGETLIPNVRSARVEDVADTLIGSRAVEKRFIGVRPGEKIHEVLVSPEEGQRTILRGSHYVLLPLLPELREHVPVTTIDRELSSANVLQTPDEVHAMLEKEDLLLPESV